MIEVVIIMYFKIQSKEVSRPMELNTLVDKYSGNLYGNLI